MISELKAETRVTMQLLITAVTRGITNKGSAYLSLSLQDSTGQIEAKKWEVSDEDYKVLIEGNVIEFEADVLDYKGNLQLKIISTKFLDQKDVDATLFVPSAPISRKVMQDKLLSYISLIKDEEIRKVVDKLVNENYLEFMVFPAAVKIHHAYANGLLHHTTTMLQIASNLASLYKEIDTDYLYAGVILHDIGKTKELSGIVTPRYTLEGKLVGHISIMQAMIKEACKELKIDDQKTILLQHMILSHHGEKEKGSPVLPSTLEAVLLSLIDDLDAKVNTIIKALDQIEVGEFTPRMPFLEDKSFYKYHK